MTNIQPEVGLERLVDLSTISNSSTTQVAGTIPKRQEKSKIFLNPIN
jgi:hypothetical protein